MMAVLPVPPDIFQDNGIRGVFGETLTAPAAKLIGRALAAEARAAGEVRYIALERDDEKPDFVLARALEAGLNYGGMRALNGTPAMATPAFYHWVMRHCRGNGVKICQNSPSDGAHHIKMILGDKALSGEEVRVLYRRIKTGDYRNDRDQPPRGQDGMDYGDENAAAPLLPKAKFNIQEDYINAVCDAIFQCSYRSVRRAGKHNRLGLAILLNADNKKVRPLARRLYKRLGCEVITNETGANAVLTFDGDGGRFCVMLPGETGEPEIIPPDRLLVLFARDMLARNPGCGVVYDEKLPADILKPFVENRGGTLIPADCESVQSQIKTAAPIGGDASGRFYFSDWHGFEDGLFAGARLVRILAEGGRMYWRGLEHGLSKGRKHARISAENGEIYGHGFADGRKHARICAEKYGWYGRGFEDGFAVGRKHEQILAERGEIYGRGFEDGVAAGRKIIAESGENYREGFEDGFAVGYNHAAAEEQTE